MKSLALLALVAGASIAAGCATKSAAVDPATETHNPDLKISFTGSETRVPAFERVVLAPFALDFRPADPMSGPRGYSQTRTAFPVPEQDRKRIAEIFNEVFREELGDNEHFKLAGQPGPGALLIKPALRDIVSYVPPEEPIGSSRVFLDRVGEATLVIEFADGESGRTIATTTDRRGAEPVGAGGSGFGAVRATDVTTGHEIRRLARRWAMTLESRLEKLHSEAGQCC